MFVCVCVCVSYENNINPNSIKPLSYSLQEFYCHWNEVVMKCTRQSYFVAIIIKSTCEMCMQKVMYDRMHIHRRRRRRLRCHRSVPFFALSGRANLNLVCHSHYVRQNLHISNDVDFVLGPENTMKIFYLCSARSFFSTSFSSSATCLLLLWVCKQSFCFCYSVWFFFLVHPLLFCL